MHPQNALIKIKLNRKLSALNEALEQLKKNDVSIRETIRNFAKVYSAQNKISFNEDETNELAFDQCEEFLSYLTTFAEESKRLIENLESSDDLTLRNSDIVADALESGRIFMTNLNTVVTTSNPTIEDSKSLQQSALAFKDDADAAEKTLGKSPHKTWVGALTFVAGLATIIAGVFSSIFAMGLTLIIVGSITTGVGFKSMHPSKTEESVAKMKDSVSHINNKIGFFLSDTKPMKSDKVEEKKPSDIPRTQR